MTEMAELDRIVTGLRDAAPSWVHLGLDERIELLDELAGTVAAAGDGWATAAAQAKGIRRTSPAMAEDWGSGVVMVLRNVQLLGRTLREIRETGRPAPPSIRMDEHGRTVIDVYPADLRDRVLLPGFHAEVRLQEGITPEQARDAMARIYHEGHVSAPEVALVLGAGNVSSIGPMDALTQLFAEDRVVLLKLNPVNEYLEPHLEAALWPLIRGGWLRIITGGPEVGREIVEHPAIDAVHLTGSDRTYEAIMFGEGPEGEKRRRSGVVLRDLPVTAELGNVTPVIVVPGPWTPAEIAHQGDNIASMLVQNAGFNCIAARMIVQHGSWSRREALNDAIRDSLRDAEPREAYYPGARARWERFTSAHPEAEWFGPDGGGNVPFTFIPDLDPRRHDDIAFTTEAFCGIFGEVPLDAPRSVPAFLEQAVDFCNDRLWGTLSASILVHPRTLADPESRAAVERAIDRLNYGSVVINHWSAAPYAMVTPPWGAAPGAVPTDIQSGVGMVHNTYLLEGVQKTVVRGPFRPPVAPPWSHTHRTLNRLLPRAARLLAARDVPSLLGALRQGG